MHTQARFGMLRTGLLILPLGLMAAGCGSSLGTVSGKVTYKGEVVKGGTIRIVPEKGPPATGDIQEDGTYKITHVATGPAKVSVETDSIKPMKEAAQGRGAMSMYKNKPPPPPPGSPGSDMDPSKSVAGFREQGDEKRYVAIPARYSDANKSGLSLTVKGGNNEFNIELK